MLIRHIAIGLQLSLRACVCRFNNKSHFKMTKKTLYRNTNIATYKKKSILDLIYKYRITKNVYIREVVRLIHHSTGHCGNMMFC